MTTAAAHPQVRVKHPVRFAIFVTIAVVVAVLALLAIIGSFLPDAPKKAVAGPAAGSTGLASPSVRPAAAPTPVPSSASFPISRADLVARLRKADARLHLDGPWLPASRADAARNDRLGLPPMFHMDVGRGLTLSVFELPGGRLREVGLNIDHPIDREQAIDKFTDIVFATAQTATMQDAMAATADLVDFRAAGEPGSRSVGGSTVGLVPTARASWVWATAANQPEVLAEALSRLVNGPPGQTVGQAMAASPN